MKIPRATLLDAYECQVQVGARSTSTAVSNHDMTRISNANASEHHYSTAVGRGRWKQNAPYEIAYSRRSDVCDLAFLRVQPFQAAKKMEKELRLQIERLQEDKNYNDQMYREVTTTFTTSPCFKRLQYTLDMPEMGEDQGLPGDGREEFPCARTLLA